MRLGAICVTAFIIMFAVPAHAQLTEVGLQLTARVLGFMERPLTGTVRLGVIYIPNDASSIQGADAVISLLGTGLRAGNLLFTPVRVRIDQAAAAPVDAFFLPDGLGDQAKPIIEAEQKKKVPCITFDLAQVRNGICVLGLQIVPKVQIYVSRVAAANSDTTFVSMFRMMITED
jgi:hypothetical protein